MSTFRNLLMQQQKTASDLAEVYDYASTYGITSAQIDTLVEQKPALRSRLIAWKYLVHSLFDTGCTPYLCGDGVAWIDTGIYSQNGIIAELDCIVTQRAVPIFGCRELNATTVNGVKINNPNTIYTALVAAVNNYYTTYYGSVNAIKNTLSDSSFVTTRHKYKVSNEGAYYDGTKFSTFDSSLAVFTIALPIYLYTIADYDGTNISTDYKNRFSQAKICRFKLSTSSEDLFDAVPYCDNGVYGMLDLTTDTFKASAVQNGLFGYELRDSNNNTIII